eukprot:GEZU01013256.1.p2 GENE.GEZU01013256.1~~GEZU01013256.1.p2  ORF type:complete len:106 (+),score=12.67 GEZU01013256.1:450-767(+)
MMMDLIDENNSKTVEFSEFLTLVEFLTLIQIRFNDIDTDGNNKITRSELTRLTKSMGFDFNASAANFFFKMVDAVRDSAERLLHLHRPTSFPSLSLSLIIAITLD